MALSVKAGFTGGLAKPSSESMLERPFKMKVEDSGLLRRRRRRTSSRASTASQPNEAWTYDFLHDACANGRRLKLLTVTDEFTRESICVKLDNVRLGRIDPLSFFSQLTPSCGSCRSRQDHGLKLESFSECDIVEQDTYPGKLLAEKLKPPRRVIACDSPQGLITPISNGVSRTFGAIGAVFTELTSYFHQAAYSTRARNRSSFPRPYICRLINFSRCT